MELVVLIYKFTENLPVNERFGLVSQMRRASVSIPSNIAEGRRRDTRRDYRQFLIISRSSGAELETQLEISSMLNFGPPDKRKVAEELLNEVMRILSKMINNLH